MAIKYLYKGIPINEVCKEKDYSVSVIRRLIKRKLNEDSSISVDDAVITVIDSYIKVPKNNVKYFYKGISLRQYCQDNNINYYNITLRIEKLEISHPKLSMEEIIKEALKKQYHLRTTLFYKGIPLKQYCEEHDDMSYGALKERIERTLKKDPTKKIDDIVDEYINRERKNGYKYYYKGIPLIIYCRLNDINYISIYTKMYRKSKISDKSLDKIIDDAIKTYYKYEVKYFYNGISLYQYCAQNNIKYSTIMTNVLRQKKKSKKDIQTIINESIANYKKNRTIHYYNETTTLADKCKEQNVPYAYIYNRLKVLNRKNIFDTSTERIDYAISEYIKTKNIKEQNAIFEYLKESKSISQEELQSVCSILNIKLSTVENLMDLGFTYYQSISIIWFFHDSKYNEILDISENKLKDIFELINQLNNETKEQIKKRDLFDLYKIYKCNLQDTRELMIINITSYVTTTIKKILFQYNIKYEENIMQEFKSIAMLSFLILIEKTFTNNGGGFIKYFDKTIKFQLRTKIKEFYFERKTLTLNQSINDNDKNENINKIIYTPSVNEEAYSDDTINVLAKLSDDDRNYIILRFQEQYSYEELANYYGVSINTIIEQEKRLLNLLKNEETLIKLDKKRKPLSE